jgi:ADP-ribose pyrophosphatase YjhB (NUDIX family)
MNLHNNSNKDNHIISCKLNNICNNCNKVGHRFYNCKLPIISYGIILFRLNTNNKIEYLMIKRKNSYGFIELIQGKYSLNNLFQLQQSVDEMSLYEKSIIVKEDFNTLWKYMWNYPCSLTHNIPTILSSQITYNCNSDEYICYKKFNNLKYNGVKNKRPTISQDTLENENIKLENIINNSKTNWKDTEWEFPKGRKNLLEKDIDCAIREFEEETGISKNTIHIVNNILPFEEVYVGSNYKSYKTKFYLAYTDCDIDNYQFTNFQKTEVSEVSWKTLNECLQSLRIYNVEKKRIITNIDNMISNGIFTFE